MNENKNRGERERPTFSVEDELRRNRRMRLSSGIRKARRVRQAAVTAAICIFVVLFLTAALALTVFRVQTVTVKGNQRYSAEQLTAAIALRPTDCIFLLDEKTILSRILKSCPYVASVSLEKQYPAAISVTVEETRSVYTTEMFGERILMDAGFRVIGHGVPDGDEIEVRLPEIHSAVEGEVIRFTDAKHSEYVFSVLPEILNAELPITFADLQNRFSLSVRVGDTAQILLGDTAQIPLKLQVAKKVLEAAAAEGSARTKIDASDPGRVSASYDWSAPFDD